MSDRDDVGDEWEQDAARELTCYAPMCDRRAEWRDEDNGDWLCDAHARWTVVMALDDMLCEGEVAE